MKNLFYTITLFFISNSVYSQFANGDTLLIEGNPNIIDCLFYDLDQDGDQDLLSLNYDLQSVYFYKNNLGIYTEKDTLLYTMEYPVEILVEDYNNNGTPDICIITHYGNATFYENDGNEHFVMVTQLLLNYSYFGDDDSHLIYNDIDGDGVKDIIFGAYQTYWYKNLGNFNFVYQQTSSTHGFITSADVNNDSYQDILVCVENTLQVNLNDGTGNLPIGNVIQYGVSSGVGDITQMVLYDYDNDGDLDAIILNSTTNKIYARLNNGAGVFSTSVPIYSAQNGGHYIHDLLNRDINNDGIPDLVFQINGPSSNKVLCLIGNGGTFQAAQTLYNNYDRNTIDISNTNSNAIPEMALDLFSTNNVESLSIFSSDTTSTIAYILDQHVERFASTFDGTLIFGDLDNDGDNDFWNYPSLYRNNGDYNIEPIIDLFDSPFLLFNYLDINEDGNLDIVGFSSNNNLPSVRYNTGNGTFGSEIPLTNNISYTTGIEIFVFDQNQDGLLDIIYPNYSNNQSILGINFNLGDGMFSPPNELYPPTVAISNITLMKVNEEQMHFQELSYALSANYGSSIYVGINDPYQTVQIFNDPNTTIDELEISDLDEDGLTDVVYSDYNGIYWQRNLGNGTFSNRIILENIVGYKYMICEDMDNDNDDDLVFLVNDTIYWKKNIAGTFETSIAIPNLSIPTWSHNLYAVDMTGDGFRDIIYTINNNPKRIFLVENTFVPCTITGKTYNDIDGDHIQDAGEQGIPGVPVTINPGNITCISDNNGDFTFHPAYGTYTLTAGSTNNWSITSSTVCTSSVSQLAPNTNTCRFGYTTTTSSLSALINLTSSNPTCGEQSLYQITAKNNGTQTQNGIVKLNLPAPQTFISSNPIPDSIVGSNYYWHYDSLTSGVLTTISVSVIMPVASGSILNAFVELNYISSSGGTAQSMSDSLTQTVNCSETTIEKLVEPAGIEQEHYIPIDQEWLEYTIRFTNDGLDTVKNVKVYEQLASNLQFSTLEVIGSSHPYSISIEPGNQLVFSFQNINLPQLSVNSLESHGFITFRVKIQPLLPHLTQITNVAKVQFDNQISKFTNTTLTTLYRCELTSVFQINANDFCMNEFAHALIQGNVVVNQDYNSAWYLDGQYFSGGLGFDYYPNNVAGTHELTLISTHPFCPQIQNSEFFTFHDPYVQLNPDTLTTCWGQAVMLYGDLYSNPGLYSNQLQSIYGCDSTLYTYLLVLPYNETIIDVITICEGESAIIWGVPQSTNNYYSEVYTGINGCDSTSTIQLIVLPTPIIHLDNFNESTICIQNDPVLLPIGYPIGGTYFGNGVTGNQFDPTITGIGTYFIYYSFTDTTNCSSLVSVPIVVEDCLGINEYSENNIILYPNPFTNSTTIQFSQELGGTYDLVMHDLMGKLVYFKSDLLGKTQLIERNTMASGVYQLTIIDHESGIQLIKRLVIE